MTTIYRLTEYGDTIDFPTLEAAQAAVRAAYDDEAPTLAVRGGTRIVDERGEQVGEVVEECLYSFDLSNFEDGRFTATRYPTTCAVGGDWVCVASSDAEALALARSASETEWAEPDTRRHDDFEVEFVDASSL